MLKHNKQAGLFDVSKEEVISLFKNIQDPEGKTKKLLYVIGGLLTPITAIGALWGYVRAYNRHLKQENYFPVLANLQPISRVAMILGSVFIWVILFVSVFVLTSLAPLFFGENLAETPVPYIFLAANLILTFVALFLFKKWQNKTFNGLRERTRFGTAQWAKPAELEDLAGQNGLYIGGEIYAYKKQGHILTVAGTRSGKFVNLIAPNLLGHGGYSGSTFVIDPKGEVAAVTARYQRQKGNRVLILDPWGINPNESASYNPLDLVSGQSNPDFLCDDVSVIAEMVVPKELSGDQYWNNRARSLISGLILHLVTSRPPEQHNLETLWRWLRLPEDEWIALLADMAVSDNEIVQACANEFISLMKSAEKTFTSIMSSAQDKTDFLKSPALRRSLQSSSFNINTLSDGQTTLYVIIPPNLLETQSQWLRLVFTTALRAVIRNRNKRVTFILDECAALGYLPELKTALSTYAGYNVTVWPFFQDLSQIKSLYGNAWETFLGNTAVRHFFGVNDNFTAAYLEKIIGTETVVTHEKTKDGPKASVTARPLATADEIRRGSGDNIFTFIEQRPPTYFAKAPYYEIPSLYETYDDNPYYTPDVDSK